ncbi:MAG: hypothetical protein ACWA5R_09025 [bacterium]
MRQIKKDGRLPAEKMSTLAAVLFIPAFIIFALSFKGISTWRNGIKLETEQIKIESFVKKAYQPLSSSRQSLQNNLSQMQSLIQNIESMALSYPNHAELIQKVKQQWGTGQDALSSAYVETDREVRRAWIAHNTLDSQDVFAKFSKQAVYLESQIKKAEKDYDVHLHSVQGEMTKAVNDASQLIRALRKPAKSKKQQLKNKALREKIRPFNQSLTAELIGYVGQIDKRLEQQILTFQELIRISGQQSAILRDHLYQNPDLEKPLTKIINNWKTLESDSSLRLQQIFYAIEAEYVAVKLGLPEKNSAIEALRKNMRTIVPEVVGQSLKRRKAIDQSYNINRS